jgi:hypothetical protein
LATALLLTATALFTTALAATGVGSLTYFFAALCFILPTIAYVLIVMTMRRRRAARRLQGVSGKAKPDTTQPDTAKPEGAKPKGAAPAEPAADKPTRVLSAKPVSTESEPAPTAQSYRIKANSFETKGMYTVAAKLYEESAYHASTEQEVCHALISAMNCYLKANHLVDAKAMASGLQARSSSLTTDEALEVRAVLEN